MMSAVSLKTNGFFISHFSVGGYQFSPTAWLSPSHVYPANPINYEYLCRVGRYQRRPIFSTRHWLMPNLHFWSSYGFLLFSISLFYIALASFSYFGKLLQSVWGLYFSQLSNLGWMPDLSCNNNRLSKTAPTTPPHHVSNFYQGFG